MISSPTTPTILKTETSPSQPSSPKTTPTSQQPSPPATLLRSMKVRLRSTKSDKPFAGSKTAKPKAQTISATSK